MPKSAIPPTLRLSRYLDSTSRFLVASTRISPGCPPNRHRHDFAEFFWITEGRCTHRFDGGSEVLEPGDLRFVRPEHVHEFDGLGPDGALLTNIALPADFIPAWQKAYASLKGRFFWSSPGHPAGYRMNQEMRDFMNQAATALAGNTSDLLVLHHSLMRLFLYNLSYLEDRGNPLPVWLEHALEKLGELSVFSAGVPGFVRVCGRSAEHVSRATRKYLAATASELVNRARMRYAAQQLRMTDHTILTIMLDCGLANPSHFYTLFKTQYGETPRQYRMHRNHLVGHLKPHG